MDLDTNEERYKLAYKEIREVYQWDIKESNKIRDKLKKEGKYIGGLDGHYPEIDAIEAEGKRRIKEIIRKYYPEKNV